MRTVTISNSFSYIIGSPEERIRAIRDKATNDVTNKFHDAAEAAIMHYYGCGPEEFSADSAPFLVVKKEGGNVWQINDKQTGEFIFGSVPCRVGSNDVTIQELGEKEPRFQRTIYISQDYTTCVPA
ncbi:hypothetical protein SEGES_51 [Klebsiella phage vB_KpnS_SegesCirculi]|uniref:Uncharacterized protein n=1 Tax=Klebsiella phage vB_KpnS_SegesCirculi TaxID=2591374 RepID=A0A5B9NNL8_9CAUD|nr:hypothetical protein H1N99_gp51 [Klebsiella phage vB_KpnS_SegesCirculi]QEG12583.1 hypothetical protein SEGES_51 [Klebsiella phage vB_KpnS_SegesCirculi]QPX75077.1 hypothetical protein [Klebsiella phage vB_KpnS_SegesCirculi]